MAIKVCRLLTVSFMVTLLLPGLCIAQTGDGAGSGIYRSVDENGNTVFTDQRPSGVASQEVRLEKINTVPVKKVDIAGEVVPVADDDTANSAFSGYDSLTITAPANQATLRNPSAAVEVSVELTPSLQKGDRIVIYDNGVAQPGMALEAPERGAHSVQAKVVGEQGGIKAESAAIEIYIHQSTAYDYERRPGNNANGAAANVGSAAGRGGAAKSGGSANTGGAAGTGGAARRITLPALTSPGTGN